MAVFFVCFFALFLLSIIIHNLYGSEFGGCRFKEKEQGKEKEETWGGEGGETVRQRNKVMETYLMVVTGGRHNFALASR
jgi:hypothetical protein